MSSRCVLCVIVILALLMLVAMPSYGLGAAPAGADVQGAPTAAREGLAQGPAEVGRIAFVHAAPFAEVITDTVVTFEIDGSALPGQMQFGDASGYLEFPAGTYTFTVVAAAVFTEPITATVVISPDQDSTLVLASTAGPEPPALLQILDNWTVPGPGKTQFRVMHGAPFDADPASTAVDVRTADGTVVDGLEGVVYGDVSEYMTATAGILDLMITAAGEETALVEIDPLVAKDGDVYSIYVIGGANEWPVEPLVVLQYPQDPARLSLAHLAPVSVDVEATSVSVFIDNTEVLTNVTYSGVSPYLEVTAGLHSVAVVPTGVVTPVLTGTLILGPAMDYTAAVVGNATLQPIDLLITMDINTRPPAGMARLNVVHAAPFTDTITNTVVDIRTGEGDVFQGLENVAYGQQSGALLLDPGEYDLNVTAPGGAPVLLNIPTIVLEEGDVGTLFVVGDNVNQDLDAILVAGEERNATDIRFAHLAPFTDMMAASVVTVTANGQDIVTGLAYRDITDYAGLPVSIYGVTVTPMGMTDPVLGGAMYVTWDEIYTAAVIGDGANGPLDIFVLRDDGDITAPTDMALVRIVHVAPFTSTLAATAVNVVAQDGEPFTDITDLTYKEVTEFMEMAPGTYDLAVTSPADDSVLLDIPAFSLAAGDKITIFIVGEGVNQPLGAVMAPDQFLSRLLMPLSLKNAMLP